MKKLLSIVLAVVMLTAMTTTAFAAEPIMPDQNGNVSIGKDEITIGIEGRVEPITLAATCNISTYLSIDPNQPVGQQFISPVITVSNDCNAPITLYAVGMKATGSAPKVVAHDKYSAEGWQQLSRAQTHANIALGLKDADGGSLNMWFAEESAQQTSVLCNIPFQGQQRMKLQAQFGRAWDGGESFKYGMTLKIGLQQ
jgi:hypothetical protein